MQEKQQQNIWIDYSQEIVLLKTEAEFLLFTATDLSCFYELFYLFVKSNMTKTRKHKKVAMAEPYTPNLKFISLLFAL